MFECVCEREKEPTNERKEGGWQAVGRVKYCFENVKRSEIEGIETGNMHKMCFQSLRRMNLWEVAHFAFSKCVMTTCPLTPVFV